MVLNNSKPDLVKLINCLKELVKEYREEFHAITSLNILNKCDKPSQASFSIGNIKIKNPVQTGYPSVCVARVGVEPTTKGL